MIVPAPTELTQGMDGIYRPDLQNGSAHPLAMTAKQLAKVKRRKQPFGFHLAKTKKRH